MKFPTMFERLAAHFQTLPANFYISPRTANILRNYQSLAARPRHQSTFAQNTIFARLLLDLAGHSHQPAHSVTREPRI